MNIRALWRYWRPVAILLVLAAIAVPVWLWVAEYLRWDTYVSTTPPAFSVKYLKGSNIVADYLDALSPVGNPVRGVRFDIPTKLLGANWLVGAHLSVEYIDATPCTADLFLPAATSTGSRVEEGVSYSVASNSFGDVSNKTFERVYALTGSQPCTAVHYFLNTSSRVGFDPNAPPTASQPSASARNFNFNEALKVFDTMRHSLKLNQK